MVSRKVLLSTAALAEGSVIIRQTGYPQRRVNQRAACGERHLEHKRLDYLMSIIFHGFRDGTCADIGYTTPEGTTQDDAGHEIFLFSRDPTMADVAGCIADECGEQLSTLVRDGYTSDVKHCISPAFGPCAPKAWDCLGDAKCLEAVECGPKFARACTQEIADLMSDPAEREKIMCVENCGDDSACVVLKCGRNALDCLTGADKLCHDALMCLPRGLAGCSRPAVDCLFQKDGLCNENLHCLSDGIGVCADPAVNMLTNSHVADALHCANSRCPSALSTADETEVALATSQPSNYAEQLACIGLRCHPLQHIFEDSALAAVASCAGDASSQCDISFWDCLGDQSCVTNLRCWMDGLGGATDDFWKMITDDAERAFDAALVQCVESCDKGNKIADAVCVATHCGGKALRCLDDTTCRKTLLDIPRVASQCLRPSMNDPMFMKGVHCAGSVLNQCGKAGLELARDNELADLVSCQAQCTRDPSGAAVEV